MKAAVSWFKILSGTCLDGLRKNTNNTSQDSRFSTRDLNLEPPQYEAILIHRQRRFVLNGDL